jgi:nucleoside-diphosphate-sugar epimerase
VNTISEVKQAKILVIGGTGVVGSYIVEHLVRRGERPFVLSRSQRDGPGIEWIRGDMTEPEALNLPAVTTLYCTADAVLLANILPRLC